MKVMDRHSDPTGRGLVFNAALFLALAVFAVVTSRQPLAAVGLAAGMAAAAALLRRVDILPKLGVFAIVGAVPFDTVTRTMWDPMTTLPKLVFVPAFVVFVAICVLNRRPVVLGRQVWTAAAFAGSALLSALLTGGALTLKLAAVQTVIGVFLFLVLAVNVLESERDVHVLLWIVLISNAVSAGISLGLGGYRLTGAMHNDAPGLGINAVTGLCVAPYLFVTAGRKWIKAALVGMAAVLILTVLHNLSRVAMIGVALCAVYAVLRWRSSLRLGTVLLCLAAAGLLAWPFLPILGARLRAVSTDGSVNLRIETATAGLHMFMESPLWGVGPGQFTARYASQEYRHVSAARGFTLLNAYVQALAEQGLLGLIPFLLLVVFSFRDLWAAARCCDPRSDPRHGPPGADVGSRSDAMRRLRWQIASIEVCLLHMVQAGLSQPSLYSKYAWMVFALSAVVFRLTRGSQEGDRMPPARKAASG